MIADDDYADLRIFFADEATECLNRCRAALTAFAAGEYTELTMGGVRRDFHNIKGTALSLPGLEVLGESAAQCERVAEALDRGQLAMNPGVLGLLNAGADYLAVQFQRVRASATPQAMPAVLWKKFEYCRDRILQLESAAPSSDPLSLDDELKSL
ncbi:Hpt domain-containing protein [Litorivivens sp.]|uniref:Hpt domain-containing protein n=2 Tax=Litorivivens sp. TaxID=2020868 RepID=UPI003561DA27